MAERTPVAEGSENAQKIATFAVIDLETTNLPAYNNNRVGITELCIYAFDAAILKDNNDAQECDGDKEEAKTAKLPIPPRVMHKLNLLFQPSMNVHPDAEKITGLSNYLLERETKFDESAAQTILGFLKHLAAPVCLVAHNGWFFDFPIVKHVFAKHNLELPSGIICVDSLRAFLEIDETRKQEHIKASVVEALEVTAENDTTSEKAIDWRVLNETTPKRPILAPAIAAVKRKQLAEADAETPPSKRVSRDLHARRQLFCGLNCAQKKRFPPRDVYKLGNLFERIFDQPSANAHRAEADVYMLTKLMQHYGVDFLAFAEEEAIPFADVIPLGGKTTRK